MAAGNIIFRRAVAEDAVVVARIIALALGEELTRYLCGDAGEGLFEDMVRRDDTQYSYRNAIVCEIDSEVVGAVCGYDGARLYELREPVIEAIRMQCGRVPDMADETSAGEFYIDTVGVLPHMQRQGLGTELICRMSAEAFAAGYERVGLLVDSGNPSAGRLYESLGFKRIDEVGFLGHKMYHMQSLRP